MKHTPSTTTLRRAAGLLAMLAILMMSASLARGAALSATPAYQVYLPLVRNASSGTTTPTPPSPSQARMVLDQPRATYGSIGAEGGTLRATAADGTRFELAIPPNALDFTETITMTPASAVDNLPLSGGLAGAVSLEPAGLTFYEPATLTIAPARSKRSI
jgi:hypothetical protein